MTGRVIRLPQRVVEVVKRPFARGRVGDGKESRGGVAVVDRLQAVHAQIGDDVSFLIPMRSARAWLASGVSMLLAQTGRQRERERDRQTERETRLACHRGQHAAGR